MNPTITANISGDRTRLRSPLLDGILECVDATYNGVESIEIGDPQRADDPGGLGSFLSFALAYPPGVKTPVVTVRGLLSPTSERSLPTLGNRTIVLASGGIDSTAAMLHLLDMGRQPVALWCNYGQPYSLPERRAVREICVRLGVPLIEVEVDLGDYVARDTPFGHVIPARNFLIAACAAVLEPEQILLAGLADELVVPDKSLRMYAEAGQHLGVSISSPFVSMTKTEVLRVWAQRWDAKLAASRAVSCYRADGDCQDCSACAKRAVAMVASGYLVDAFPVFRNQQSLITGKWFERLAGFPSVRRADLLIALDLIRDSLPSSYDKLLRAVEAYAPEVEARRAELTYLRDVG